MCVIPTREYFVTKEGIHEIDPNAFFVVSDAYEVHGNKQEGDSVDLIVLRNVRKQYKTGVVAIHDLNLNTSKGDFDFVIGSPGCGNSTLIKM